MRVSTLEIICHGKKQRCNRRLDYITLSIKLGLYFRWIEAEKVLLVSNPGKQAFCRSGLLARLSWA